jgi:hypothetical protein
MARAPRPPLRWRPPGSWTSADQLILKIAGTFLVMGTLAHVLPAFGLQFRKLAQLGSAAPAAGTTMIVLGLLLALYVLLLKGHVLRALLALGALGALALAGLLALGWYQSRAWRAPRPAPVPGQAPTGVPAQPWATGPGAAPSPAAGGAPARPSAFTPPTFDAQRAELIARHGATRVLEIDVTGVSGIDLGATVRRAIEALPPGERPGSWRAQSGGNTGRILLAPVDKLEDVRVWLTFGTLSEPAPSAADQPARATLTLDAARCVPARGR